MTNSLRSSLRAALVRLSAFVVVAMAAVPAGAAFQSSSMMVDTHANILAKTGLYTQQRAYASNFNNAEVVWNGSAWVWAPYCQNVFRVRADVTAPVDTADNVLATVTLPKLGSEDGVRVAGFVAVTNNANVKTFTVKLGTAGSMSNGFSSDIGGNGSFNFVSEFRNQASASAQEWFTSNKAIFGSTSGSLATTAKATGTAGTLLTVGIQKATAGDSAVLHWLDVSICGAGAV